MAADSTDTDQLVQRASRGNEDARDALLNRHRRRLKRLFRNWMHPQLAARVDPSDAVQETLLVATRRLPKYLANRPLPFFAWLKRIGWERLVQLNRKHVHATKRSVRKEIRLGPSLTGESTRILARHLLSAKEGPAGQLLKKELQQRLRQALEALPEKDREILVLRHLEQLSNKDIAVVLQLSESTVKLRHFRAVRRIRELLDREGDMASGGR